MKLAIVRRRLAPHGGAERFIENIVQALDDTRVEATLISESEGAGLVRRGQVLQLPSCAGSRSRRHRIFQNVVTDTLSRYAFDVIQSHERIVNAHIFRAGDGVHAAWVDRLSRERSWWRRRAMEFDRFHRHLIETERKMARQTDMIFVANSQMVARELTNWLDLPASRIRTIENGVDLSAFRPPTPKQRAGARARFKLPPDEQVVAFVGGGFERKGAFPLVRALATGSLRGKAALIAGHDKRSGSLDTLIRKLGLESRVTVLGPVAGAVRVFHASDVFVLPTLYDPMPNAAVEAIACGLPVVTTPEAGIAEVVAEHGAGSVCGRDIEDLAAAIAETFEQIEPRRRAALGLRDRFELSHITAQWLGLYREFQ